MRCFIALALPPEARKALEKAASSLRSSLPGLSWTKSENYHITLAFLGEIGDSDVVVAATSLDAVAEFGAIPFSFSALNGFPSKSRWRVLAATVDDGGRADACRRLVLGALSPRASRPEGGEFSAHVTMARRSSREGGLAVEAVASPAGSWEIDRCALYKSELRRSGAVYTELRGVDL